MAHRYEVLGSLRVGDRPDLTPRRPAQRRLLAVLLLEQGRDVPRDRLIDRLWDEAVPGNPINTLQAHVSALRKLLGPQAVRSGPAGYAVDVSGGIDAQHFDDLVAKARGRRASDDHAGALEHAAAALALWRGPPYPELADAAFARPEIARLHELRDTAVEFRVEALISLGRQDEAAEELEGLVLEHPHRERLWEHLMVARYQSGRQADALSAYRRAREALLELGLEPHRRLRHLERRILSHDPALAETRAVDEVRTGPTAPIPAAGDHRALATRPLPSALHRWALVGRRTELDRADALLVEGGLGVVVVGTAGVGKSRMLHELGSRARARGTAVVWLRANQSLRSIPLGVASHLGTGTGALTGQLQDMIDGLRSLETGHGVLLLVDDAHHLDDPTTALITRALEGGSATAAVTVRSDEHVPPSITRWWTDVGLERIALGPLTGSEAEALTGVALGPAAATTRRQLGALAGGNPLHLREIVRAARESGALVQMDGRWNLQRPVASAGRLTELVDANLRQLGAAPQKALALLALARPIAVEVLEDLIGRQTGADGPDALDALETHELVIVAEDAQGVPVADVLHPLYAENIGSRLPRARRREIARTLADGLERHRFPATGDVLRAASLRLEVGELEPALAARACEEALMRLDAVLAMRLAEVATAGEEATGAWRLRGRAAYYLGDSAEADRSLVRAAELATTPSEVVDVASEHAGMRGFGMRDPAAAIGLLDAALERLGSTPLTARLRVERATLLAMKGRLREVVMEAEVLGQLELPAEARLTNAVSGTMARALIGDVVGLEDAIVAGLELADDMRARFPLARDQLQANYEEALAAQGRVAEAVSVAVDQDARAQDAGGLVTLSLPQLVHLRTLAGEVAEAVRLVTERGDDMRGPDPFGMSLLWPAYAAMALVQVGDAEAAARTLAAGERSAALGEVRTAVWWCRAESWLLLPDTGRACDTLVAAGREAVAGDHVVWAALALYDVVRLGRPEAVVDDLTGAAAMTRGAHLVEALARSAAAHADGDPIRLAAVAEHLRELGTDLLAAEAWVACARCAGTVEPALRDRAWESAVALTARLGAATPALAAAGIT